MQIETFSQAMLEILTLGWENRLCYVAMHRAKPSQAKHKWRNCSLEWERALRSSINMFEQHFPGRRVATVSLLAHQRDAVSVSHLSRTLQGLPVSGGSLHSCRSCTTQQNEQHRQNY